MSNAAPTSVGYGLHSVAGLGKSSLMSSATVVKKAVKRFGLLFLKAINKPTATATFGALIKKYSLQKLIVALAKTLGKPIMSNDGTTRFASG